MSTYYYLVAGLPDLSLDDGKLSYTVDSFKAELYPFLTAGDQKLVDLFYLKYDNRDLLALLKDKEAVTSGRGCFSGEELLALVETVRNGDTVDKQFPPYLAAFVADYLTLAPEDLHTAEDRLAAGYYAYGMACGNRLVADWFEFNLNMGNVFAALTARKYKREVADVIVGDNAVCEQLRTSNARDFGLGEELDYFNAVQRIAEMDELVGREKQVDLLKWNWLDNASFFNYFTIERLFVFLQQIDMIERWISLDKESGSDLFRLMIRQLKEQVQIPEEFRK